ncbi:hypothetical protein EmuJ_000380400 [Echinococcus multilocularis]|uniref:Uncharacterized protein n=1 Tax=Echinococcus multilocularis TaxID=6211 RepID=A0A068XWC0_ECHMU|nr:hypothetical protein EmuJ_000380400 [Echinococcus multilocularis]
MVDDLDFDGYRVPFPQGQSCQDIHLLILFNKSSTPPPPSTTIEEEELEETNTSYGIPEINEEYWLFSTEVEDFDSIITFTRVAFDDGEGMPSPHSPTSKISCFRRNFIPLLLFCCIQLPELE